MRHYRSFLRNRNLHRAICACKGHGFRYHILKRQTVTPETNMPSEFSSLTDD